MSNTRVKIERSKAKDIRQGIVEQHGHINSDKSKKKYTHAVHAQVVFFGKILKSDYIRKFYSLASAEQCKSALEKKRYYVNLRIEEL
jgi:hypothetical protein